MSDYLDPTAFPFTVDEVRAALPLLVPEESRGEYFAKLVELVTTLRAANAAAEAARARGSVDPEEINDWILALPDDVYAAISVAVPATAPRVERLRAGWRAVGRVSRQREAMRGAGLDPSAAPTTEVLSLLARDEQALRAEWESRCARLAERLLRRDPDQRSS